MKSQEEQVLTFAHVCKDNIALKVHVKVKTNSIQRVHILRFSTRKMSDSHPSIHHQHLLSVVSGVWAKPEDERSCQDVDHNGTIVFLHSITPPLPDPKSWTDTSRNWWLMPMFGIFIWLIDGAVLFPKSRYSLIMITLGVSQNNCPSKCIAVFTLVLIWESIYFQFIIIQPFVCSIGYE